MEPGCIGKSNTNNLPAPTNLTENPYRKKILFFLREGPRLQGGYSGGSGSATQPAIQIRIRNARHRYVYATSAQAAGLNRSPLRRWLDGRGWRLRRQRRWLRGAGRARVRRRGRDGVPRARGAGLGRGARGLVLRGRGPPRPCARDGRRLRGRHRGARGANAALRGARCCSTCSCSKHTVPARAPLLPPA